MATMKSLAQLDQLNLDAATRQQVADIVQKLLDQTQQEIRAQELKIQALTLELAHLRRIRFGRKSESLPPFEHPSLFDESVLADIAAVNAEIEQIDTSSNKDSKPKAPRSRAGRPVAGSFAAH
jgi:transposase